MPEIVLAGESAGPGGDPVGRALPGQVGAETQMLECKQVPNGDPAAEPVRIGKIGQVGVQVIVFQVGSRLQCPLAGDRMMPGRRQVGIVLEIAVVDGHGRRIPVRVGAVAGITPGILPPDAPIFVLPDALEEEITVGLPVGGKELPLGPADDGAGKPAF